MGIKPRLAVEYLPADGAWNTDCEELYLLPEVLAPVSGGEALSLVVADLPLSSDLNSNSHGEAAGAVTIIGEVDCPYCPLEPRLLLLQRFASGLECALLFKRVT